MGGNFIQKEKTLKAKMEALGIYEDDLVEDFVSSSGPGGQNVNKVATCVVLHHLPTSTIVRCQKERSQLRNRYAARCLLIEKIAEARQKERLRQRHEIEKLKRKNRKRPLKLKEAILEKKRKRSDKKQSRKKVAVHRLDE